MRKAIIVGGSMGGLFAANLLIRAGWDVNVYERVGDELEGRGAGVVTHPTLLEALELAGVKVDETIGVAVEERVTLARDGSVAARRSLPQILTAWARLYNALKSAFPKKRYHTGYQVSAVEQDDSGVTAVFSNGQRISAEMLIGADGIRSTIRGIYAPDIKPLYAGYVAWRGLVEEAALSERTKKELFPYFAFGIPPHEQIIAYPVAGKNNATETGKRRFNFVWYRPADKATTLRDMVTDTTGKVWLDGIPPPLIRPEIITQARQAAHDVLAPQFAEVVEKTENLFFQPIFDVVSNQIAFGRVLLLGDAAFVARPHCGMGVTKAGDDARTLLECLTDENDIPTALKSYDKRRVEFGNFIVDHARALGAYMQTQLRTPEEREHAEMYRSVEAIMRETAVAPASQ
jgi:2-polyprenyl-6-methoxyphenol hydroxylase-like FAD-dependent oxidoreductase